ncbi:zinc finger CCHC domain-containing protein 7 [Candoia aspera]|uniref:zinc finger CCHC domain-containing protein 7 n=1 Tax=Candoia aspera TaxID=51853 RepID=UPI002FD81EA7
MMFSGYGDADALEDDLYSEGTSSETSIDSEVEFHLYSQVHYAQDLGGVSEQDNEDVKGQEEVESLKIQKSVNQQDQRNNLIVISDSDINISDSPDVITLSDTPDEDSIYESKLQKLTASVSPTLSKFNKTAYCAKKSIEHPSQIILKSKGRFTVNSSKEGKADQKAISFNQDDVPMIHRVLVTEDSSSNDDAIDVSSIASESDNVESWMLLGGVRDDKDDDILLNLEGCGTSVSEGEDRTGWIISNKDLQAQIDNYVSVRHNNRYYTADKNVACRNCDKRGHLSKNCPAPKKIPPCCLCAQRGHLQNSCPARFCLNCCLPGHCSRECPERMYWKKHCNRCDMRGHYADACPEIWRQYHLTTRPGPLKKANPYSVQPASVYCYNCAEKGHYGFECSEKRMFGGMFPTFPFIYYYDNEYDIKRSTQRAKKKVQELQEAGLLPKTLKRPHNDCDWEEHKHKKNRKALKEHGKRGDKYHKNLKKKSHADLFRERKPKKEVQSNPNTEECFPRGGHKNAHERCRRKTPVHQSTGFLTEGRTGIHHISMEPGKRQKKKKKQRSYTSNNCIRDESLFLIKQKKKKSTPKASLI